MRKLSKFKTVAGKRKPDKKTVPKSLNHTKERIPGSENTLNDCRRKCRNRARWSKARKYEYKPFSFHWVDIEHEAMRMCAAQKLQAMSHPLRAQFFQSDKLGLKLIGLPHDQRYDDAVYFYSNLRRAINHLRKEHIFMNLIRDSIGNHGMYDIKAKTKHVSTEAHPCPIWRTAAPPHQPALRSVAIHQGMPANFKQIIQAPVDSADTRRTTLKAFIDDIFNRVMFKLGETPMKDIEDETGYPESTEFTYERMSFVVYRGRHTPQKRLRLDVKFGDAEMFGGLKFIVCRSVVIQISFDKLMTTASALVHQRYNSILDRMFQIDDIVNACFNKGHKENISWQDSMRKIDGWNTTRGELFTTLNCLKEWLKHAKVHKNQHGVLEKMESDLHGLAWHEKDIKHIAERILEDFPAYLDAPSQEEESEAAKKLDSHLLSIHEHIIRTYPDHFRFVPIPELSGIAIPISLPPVNLMHHHNTSRYALKREKLRVNFHLFLEEFLAACPHGLFRLNHDLTYEWYISNLHEND